MLAFLIGRPPRTLNALLDQASEMPQKVVDGLCGIVIVAGAASIYALFG